MIEEIVIAASATYSVEGQRIAPCKAVNFFFGANGTGKTTISRVIADGGGYPSCTICWQGGNALECLVYNSDYAERNYQSTMPGIFTLGAESAETIAKIEDARHRRGSLSQDILSRQATLQGEDGSGGKQEELRQLRAQFEEACWAQKLRYDDDFARVFKGFRGSKSAFCDKVLAEQKVSAAKLCALDDLKSRATTVFEENLLRYDPILAPRFDGFVLLEGTAVLGKKVLGNEDVDLAALVAHLGNSDWVKQGLSYLDQSDSRCPFCQQGISAEIRKRLEELFDETYARDIADIDKLYETYKRSSDALIAAFSSISALESRHMDNTLFRIGVQSLIDTIQANLLILEKKKKEPSVPARLSPISAIANGLLGHIARANSNIVTHNTLVDNLAAEKATLISETWRFVLNELDASVTAYLASKDSLDKAVSGLTAGIAAKQAELQVTDREIADLERSIVSAQPTVNEINATLTSFGFTSFRLATAGDRGTQYRIVRADGSDATKTLSEGERNFITFLYFYHSLRGSPSETGLTNNRVVVFDDPVSSLDSDVLFIVSSLIHRVLVEASEGTKQIRQVFFLTHNIYFFKEVTYDSKRGAVSRHYETFWIVKKKDGESVVVGYDHNPIKTSYELLWAEVRGPERSNTTIQNTLRRILENYFKILGDLDRDEIVSKFEGRDQQICGSLFSWINDGSHSVHDDLYVSAEEGVVTRYLDVFKRIFEQTGHAGHYHMMMKTEPST